MTVFQEMLENLNSADWTSHKIAQRFTMDGYPYRYNQIERVRNGGRLVYPLDFLIAELHSKECPTANLTIVPRPPTILMTSA